MNKILSLFDEKFVLTFFNQNVLPLYPTFKKILNIKIHSYKKLIWTTTYHVVISYRIVFLTKSDKEKEIEIVCSAHSNEPRESVFKVLKFLWKSKFFKKDLVIPRPLFFSSEFNATFYRAVSGHNLLYFIKNKKTDKVKMMVEKAALLFSGLHSLSLPSDLSIFNESNKLLRDVVPGRDTIVSEIKSRFNGLYAQEVDSFYERFISQEEKFLDSTQKRWLIHGDAHPENIIAVGRKKIGLIDFTDFCPGDFARDLGTFMQQLEYKLRRHFKDEEFVLSMKNLFLETYLKESNLSLDSQLQKRIDLYYDWTIVRTAAFWLLKHECEPDKAREALKVVQFNLSNNHKAQQ